MLFASCREQELFGVWEAVVRGARRERVRLGDLAAHPSSCSKFSSDSMLALCYLIHSRQG